MGTWPRYSVHTTSTWSGSPLCSPATGARPRMWFRTLSSGYTLAAPAGRERRGRRVVSPGRGDQWLPRRAPQAEGSAPVHGRGRVPGIRRRGRHLPSRRSCGPSGIGRSPPPWPSCRGGGVRCSCSATTWSYPRRRSRPCSTISPGTVKSSAARGLDALAEGARGGDGHDEDGRSAAGLPRRGRRFGPRGQHAAAC